MKRKKYENVTKIMSRKIINSLMVTGVWDKNIPEFMETLKPQLKYDYFHAFKFNLPNCKVLSVLFHRLCGDYDNDAPEKFKELKRWLFLTDRTDKLPPGAYLTMWKPWKIYQDSMGQKIKDCEDYYDNSIDELYPEDQFRYVSLRKINEPLYYLYKPQQIINDDVEMKEQEYDDFGNPIIPEPYYNKDSNIQTSKVFEYIFRNYMGMPCEWCRNELTLDSIAVHLECSHFVHQRCLEEYTCCQVCRYT